MTSATFKVRDISDIVTKGTTPTTVGHNFTTSGINFLKVETFSPDGTFIPGKEAHIDEVTHRLLRRSQLADGDILFSIAGALGRVTLVQPSWLPANTNQAFAIIRPSARRPTVDPRYLLWQLRGPAIAKHIAGINVQAAQANLSLEQVREFELPALPLSQQASIAAALDDVNELVATLELLIVKKQAIKQGMMQQLLTGRTRLPNFATQAWRKATVGMLADQHRRTIDPRRERTRRFQHFSLPAFDEGENPVDQLGSAIDSIKFQVPPNAILVSKLNPRIPRIWAPSDIKANAIASTEFVVLTPSSGTDRSFLKWIMKSDAVTSRMKLLATGTTGSHARIHPGQIAALEILVPSVPEQTAIAEVLDEVEHEIKLIRDRLIKARSVKTGMMQQLLTGRTGLPGESAS